MIKDQRDCVILDKYQICTNAKDGESKLQTILLKKLMKFKIEQDLKIKSELSMMTLINFSDNFIIGKLESKN